MSDIFHEKGTERHNEMLYAAMLANPQHTYIILTKRPGSPLWNHLLGCTTTWNFKIGTVPLNWWIGVTGENQRKIDQRLPLLEKMPAQVRFVSVEPMLEPVNLRPYLSWLSWVIIGCESGPKRRCITTEAILDLITQCKEADVPVFVKQMENQYGELVKMPVIWNGKPLAEFPRV